MKYFVFRYLLILVTANLAVRSCLALKILNLFVFLLPDRKNILHLYVLNAFLREAVAKFSETVA